MVYSQCKKTWCYTFNRLYYSSINSEQLYDFHILTGSAEATRAESLMRLERDLFSRWCNLVFRGSMGNGPIKNFEDGLDKVRNFYQLSAD
jgi:hypothetical protein